jgi:hypothetical protein
LIYERFELDLARLVYFVASLVPSALKNSRTHQTRNWRSLELTFSIGEVSESEIIASLDQGEEYLKMLCGVDAEVCRADEEKEGVLVSEFLVTLKDNPVDQYPDMQRRMAKERFDLTLYDRRTNYILDAWGVSGVPRIPYLNYGRELLRIRQGYPREEWEQRIQATRGTAPYNALDSRILDQFDGVFLPELPT